MKTWICRDEQETTEIDAVTSKAAAEEYVKDGDWGDKNATQWIRVIVRPADDPEADEEYHTITVEPDEPNCTHDDGHDWQSPIEVVGGIEENPGVHGHGGGVIITEVCSFCGIYCVNDTWAQDSETGEQGLDHVEYREADEASKDWIESR